MQDLRGNKGWPLVAASSMRLPRPHTVLLSTTKVDIFVASKAVSLMRFYLAAFRLILEIFQAFRFVAAYFTSADGRLGNRGVVIVIVGNGFTAA